MVGDNQIDTKLDVRSHIENNSINDSVFYNSSISLDVICASGIILVILLYTKLLESNIGALKAPGTPLLDQYSKVRQYPPSGNIPSH